MTHLRQQMLEELQRRNYSQSTVRSYIHAVEDLARFFHRSPERLGPEHIRQYQAYLFRERKLSPGTIEGRTAALRFLFVKTLRRPYLPDHIPFPKRQRRLPTILDQQEVARLIDAASNLMHRTMLMMLYATGLRRAELCHLTVSDIDSQRMVIHVRQGKGGRDRDVLLTPKLLETLREYWRWLFLPFPPAAFPNGLGRLRQAALRRSRTCAQLPGPLHPPRRHLQPSDRGF